MRIGTYRPKINQTPDLGVCAVVGDIVIDLNYAYARYLREVEGELRAYDLADGRVPRDMIGFLRGGERTVEAARRTIEFTADIASDARGLEGERLRYALSEVTLLAPVPRPGKILAAGKNYADHAAEGAALDQKVMLQPFPRGFVKVSSVVIGPDDPVELPPVTLQLDYEVELAVVIGKPGRYIQRKDAYEHVAGYTILNDVSARDIQLAEAEHGNHMVGKNMDSLAPMGPWIVLRDEIPDPAALEIRLTVNGEMRQHSTTAELVHDIPAIIERWSWMTLEPGDVIATGTPAGVALGGRFPYLEPGDVMECEIEGIGVLRNAVVAGAGPVVPRVEHVDVDESRVPDSQ